MPAAPPPYQAVPNNRGDRSPLLGRSTDDGPLKPNIQTHKCCILLSLFALFIGFVVAQNNIQGSIFDPAERDRIRTGWKAEHHQVQKALDNLRFQHQQEITQFEDNLVKLRQEQQHETDEHYRILNQIRHEQQHEIQEHHATMKRLDLEREAMQRQWHSDHIKLVQLRRDIEFEEKRIEAARQDLLEERRRWEEERSKREAEERERERRLIKWGPLSSDDEPCVRYGTARYRAPLEYAPISWDPYTACMETPLRIHQNDVLPTECLHIGGQMTGIWYIDESTCKPWWGETQDSGCIRRHSGIHRYEAHLEGYLESNEFKYNWEDMCNTTPLTMFGQTFNSPSQCSYSPKTGVHGLWDIPEGACN